jgi:protein-S-isoprenylcysteine O-methyltransferase Ste14
MCEWRLGNRPVPRGDGRFGVGWGRGRPLLASLWLGVRSLIATMLLPGLLAGYIPWRYFALGAVKPDLTDPISVLGIVCIVLGAALLAACIWEFAASGRGTLAPVDPPRQLVVRGLYRYVRNPMYVGVTTILLGEVVLTRSSALLWYGIAWFVAANLFVLLYEEPTLRQRFGTSYAEYCRQVGRWIPRLRKRGTAA